MLQKILNLLRDKRGAKYFTFKEVLDGCIRHNFIALNASIAFFTLFAMVPLILLIFFIRVGIKNLKNILMISVIKTNDNENVTMLYLNIGTYSLTNKVVF